MARRRLGGPAVWAVMGLAVLGAVGWATAKLRTTILRERAETAARSEKWDEVEAALARCAWYGRLDNDTLRLRADAAERRGDPVTAARWLLAITPDHPRAAAESVRAGALLLGAFQLRKAESAYRKALAIDGRSEEALRALIVIYGVEKRSREQEEALWALHDLGDRATRIEALRLLAPGVPVIPPDALPRGIDEAELLRRACEADPGDAYATIALAELLRSRGETDAARGLLIAKPVDAEGAERPWNAAWHTAWGRLLLDGGRDAELESLIDGDAGGAGDAAGWPAMVGERRIEQGRFGEAVEAFGAAVRVDPRDPRHRYRLARALRSSGDRAEAERQQSAFQQAEELKAISAEIDDQAPDPALIARAAELCRALGRNREAGAWERLHGYVAPGPAGRFDPSGPQ